MTHPPHLCPARCAWAAFFLGTAALVGLTWMTGSSRRQPPETVGFVRFHPPVPPGHQRGVTVQLNLPPGFRARPSRDHEDTESGVANARGEPQFYVTVRLAAVQPGSKGASPLQAFARQQGATTKPDWFDVGSEFRVTVRGPVWLRRHTETVQNSDLDRAGVRNRAAGFDRMSVLRFAEEWDGMVLELGFSLRPDGTKEQEDLVWTVVRDAVLAGCEAPQ